MTHWPTTRAIIHTHCFSLSRFFQSDIWATGIIILELVLRRFPYALADLDDGGDYLDLLDSIASNEVKLLLPPCF